MQKRTGRAEESAGERLFSAQEIGELVGTSARMVLALPIRQIRVGPRTIRFTLRDVYDHFQLDNPNF